MNLVLTREDLAPKYTIGSLEIDLEKFCYTLEDTVRTGPKVPGKTAIPLGIYRVTIDHSYRFDRLMPLLLDVPGFTGVRIHSGNTAEDTEGCILVGFKKENGRITESRRAFSILFSRIQEAIKHERVYIDIRQW